MTRVGAQTERFDDGLVHNHHWAVSTDEAYPCNSQGSAMPSHLGNSVAKADASGLHGETTHPDDRHDDGLVHNHDWAVSGK
jgi:hypothetical protein